MPTMLDLFLKKAADLGASDIHLVADIPPQMRLDGELVALDKRPLTAKDTANIANSLLDQASNKRFLADRDLDVAYALGDGTRFRINLHFEKNSVGISARVIPATIPTMEEVTMPEISYDLCNRDRGLVLVTGPTGCGKSTSLATMIQYINQNRSANIITLEDPIEFIFKPVKSIIRQRQLGSDMTSFGNGLVHVLRQDPNVVMVGEMRDLETIATTITLAETGHLVFATLHTYSAAQTIDRIIDIFPPHQQNQVRMQISITLQAIISQRLLPRVDKGRVAAREILTNTPAIANLIRENKISQIKTAIQTGVKEGMVTMENAVTKLYKEGLISKETLQNQIASSQSIRW